MAQFPQIILPATEAYLGIVRPDGTTITVDSHGVLSVAGGSNGVQAVAGELIPSDCVVQLIDGQFFLADQATVTNPRAIAGIVTAQTAMGQTATAYPQKLVTGLAMLTANTTYFLGAAGRFTATAPALGLVLSVGVAQSSTNFFFELGTPIYRS